MTHATITTQLEMDGVSIEFDGDYWRYEDDIVTDLTLCFMWAKTCLLYTSDAADE